MGAKSLLRVGYLAMVAQGLLSVVLPERAIKLGTLSWRAGFENVGELEPREWYVEVTRVLGVGMLAAGATGLLLTSDEDAEDAEESDVSLDEDEDDGPVAVEIEDDE